MAKKTTVAITCDICGKECKVHEYYTFPYMRTTSKGEIDDADLCLVCAKGIYTVVKQRIELGERK